MSEPEQQNAPDLGAATDVQSVDDAMEAPDDEPTTDTPDELGGTGGRQPGGAG